MCPAIVILNRRVLTSMSQSGDTLINRSLVDRYSYSILDALDNIPDNFLITDSTIFDHPIVFASRGFLKLSGYSREEVLGKSGRLFQGPGTCRWSVLQMREAVMEESELGVTLLNYKKDGTPIWIFLRLSPVFSMEEGRAIHFIGVQVPVGRRCKRSFGWWQDGHLAASCRREVYLDLKREAGTVPWLNSELTTEPSCKASVQEKQQAAAAVENILSVLIRHSELTGKPVCRTRCRSVGVVSLSSALCISLGRIKQSFVLTDSCLHDMPIVYASDAFLRLTGYSRNEVLGRNCRFLSGPNTDVSALHQIKECIRSQQPCTVRVLNYRKDQSTFWNCLHISPVRNAYGKVAFFVGVQVDESFEKQGQELSVELRQLGTVGSVKVAVRSSLLAMPFSKTAY